MPSTSEKYIGDATASRISVVSKFAGLRKDFREGIERLALNIHHVSPQTPSAIPRRDRRNP